MTQMNIYWFYVVSIYTGLFFYFFPIKSIFMALENFHKNEKKTFCFQF